jgi:hypothetical protein
MEKARGERQLMQSLFEPDEKRGAAWGTEWGRKRPYDQGGVIGALSGPTTQYRAGTGTGMRWHPKPETSAQATAASEHVISTAA